MSNTEIERVAILREWPAVRGLQVMVTETTEAPRTVSLIIDGTPFGWTDVAQIDGTDPGAQARAVSLGEIIHDALEAAEMTWFHDDASAPTTDEGSVA